MAYKRIQKVGVRVLNPKAYMQTVLYNVAQMQPDNQKEDFYAQFFCDSAHRSSPSYDLEEYEKYDLFAHKPSYDLRDIEQFNIYNARACVDLCNILQKKFKKVYFILKRHFDDCYIKKVNF